MSEPAANETLSALLGGEDANVALVSPDGGQLTYAQLADHVRILAGMLAAAGVRRGEAVAVVLPNGIELVQLLLAVTAAGGMAAPLNPAYTQAEFALYLGDIDPRVLLVPVGGGDNARAAAGSGTVIADVDIRAGELPTVRVAGDEIDTRTEFGRAQPDDIALLLHTSGTTSRPKQVPLLQRNLTASARVIAEFYRLNADDVSYCAMPLFHIHGLVASTFAALVSGGRVVVPAPFVPRRFWAQARAHEITWLSAAPTLHQMILEKVDEEGAPTTLRFVRSSSSALSPELMARAEEVYGAPMLEAYGMTEASHQMASNPLPPDPRVPGSVGIATGTEIRIVDGNLRFLNDGNQGEVVIRGPGVTPGYRNSPEANAEGFFNGWFRTGDLGRLERGYLHLEGRLKEMILRGGENIGPAEVEEVLLAHPDVTDAVCFGVEDSKYGENVAAAVSVRGETNERELIEHCRARLAAFKVPSVIHVLPHIPRTATGKLQRRRVAALLSGRDE